MKNLILFLLLIFGIRAFGQTYGTTTKNGFIVTNGPTATGTGTLTSSTSSLPQWVTASGTTPFLTGSGGSETSGTFTNSTIQGTTNISGTIAGNVTRTGSITGGTDVNLTTYQIDDWSTNGIRTHMGPISALGGNNVIATGSFAGPAGGLTGTAGSLTSGATQSGTATALSSSGSNAVGSVQWSSTSATINKYLNVGDNTTATTGTFGNGLSQDPTIRANRNLTDAQGSTTISHGYTDDSTMSRSNTAGYASYDCRVQMTSTNVFMEHLADFQAADTINLSGTGSLNRFVGLVAYAWLQSGTVNGAYDVYSQNWTVQPGSSLLSHYGFYVSPLTDATNDWGVYVVSNKSFFGGGISTNGGALQMTGTGQLINTTLWAEGIFNNPTGNHGAFIGYDTNGNKSVLASEIGDTSLSLKAFDGGSDWVEGVNITTSGTTTRVIWSGGLSGTAAAGVVPMAATSLSTSSLNTQTLFMPNLSTGQNNFGIDIGVSTSVNQGMDVAFGYVGSGSTNNNLFFCASGVGTPLVKIDMAGNETVTGSLNVAGSASITGNLAVGGTITGYQKSMTRVFATLTAGSATVSNAAISGTGSQGNCIVQDNQAAGLTSFGSLSVTYSSGTTATVTSALGITDTSAITLFAVPQ